mmetsp:Transcript_64526/g.120067  ORF Transcript_64526/g.120067 Transcript_64526/m.120067 type:complete len:821 (-) Transcript_64526:134-2596(-)
MTIGFLLPEGEDESPTELESAREEGEEPEDGVALPLEKESYLSTVDASSEAGSHPSDVDTTPVVAAAAVVEEAVDFDIPASELTPEELRLVSVIQQICAAKRQQAPCDKEMRELQYVMRNTPLLTQFQPPLLQRVFLAACMDSVPEGLIMELVSGKSPLYILVTGAAEVVRVRDGRKVRPMQVKIEGASGLPDIFDDEEITAVVIMRIGRMVWRAATVETGRNPVFDWSTTVQHAGEDDIEFMLVLSEEAEEEDAVAHASLSPMAFERGAFDGLVELEFPLDSPYGVGNAGRLSVCVQSKAGQPQVGGIGQLRPMPTTKFANLDDISPQANSHKRRTRFAGVSVGSPTLSFDPEEQPPLSATSRKSGRSMKSRDDEFRYKATKRWTKMGFAGRFSTPSHSQTLDFEELSEGRAPEVLGPGCFFGAEEKHGVVRFTRNSHVLVVPSPLYAEMTQEVDRERHREQIMFLRRWLPGAAQLPSRNLDGFASAFQHAQFPRGHTLCTAGSGGDPESRRVYLIKSGACRCLLPPQRPNVACKIREADHVVELLGEGSLVGYASSLFGLSEPFTVVADSPVTVIWLSVRDRPVSTWPREVVNTLHNVLRQKLDWYGRRVHHLLASGARRRKGGERHAAWTLSESPFLRHKTLPAWRERTLQDLFEEEAKLSGPPVPQHASIQPPAFQGTAAFYRTFGGASLLGSVSLPDIRPSTCFSRESRAVPLSSAALAKNQARSSAGFSGFSDERMPAMQTSPRSRDRQASPLSSRAEAAARLGDPVQASLLATANSMRKMYKPYQGVPSVSMESSVSSVPRSLAQVSVGRSAF